ncbi:hypothetical protein [Sinorhizobium meliloti]|uniref:hypothetical protein n=1 Tax=Rhizobium meliloti TaxID=382 RepID=UPI00299D2379|nr:hypothetical protein [Sinorhizobium meliloti]
MKAISYFFPTMCALLVCGPAASENREYGLECVRKYYNITAESTDVDEREVAFKPDEATQLIKDIAERAGFNITPKAVTCDDIANAIPFEPQAQDQLPDELKSLTFIIYSRSWLRTVLGTQRDKAVFILGHELGHIMRQHLTERSSLTRLEMEKEADYEGACAVARLGGDWNTLLDVIAQNRDDADGDYPSAEHSTDIARVAFSECGGRLLDEDLPVTKVVYWYKRADDGKAIEALNDLGVNLDVRQSGVYMGVDFSERDTNTVTCHEGAPISLVRAVALALYDQGIEITNISRPDPENRHLTNRITVEATSRGRPQLTRSAIRDLDYCPSQYDSTYGSFRVN